MTDCLLAVDLFSDFAHEDGGKLLASLRRRRAGFSRALEEARSRALPLVYANDTHGAWNGDAGALVARALAGPGGDLLAEWVPRCDDAFVVKPRYSAFDLTPLPLVLQELDVDRILLLGTATEMCVAQTAIDARERGLLVTVVTSACATVSEDDERIALAYLERVVGVRLSSNLPATVSPA
jgi:nicotinamidase-related amidase